MEPPPPPPPQKSWSQEQWCCMGVCTVTRALTERGPSNKRTVIVLVWRVGAQCRIFSWGPQSLVVPLPKIHCHDLSPNAVASASAENSDEEKPIPLFATERAHLTSQFTILQEEMHPRREDSPVPYPSGEPSFIWSASSLERESQGHTNTPSTKRPTDPTAVAAVWDIITVFPLVFSNWTCTVGAIKVKGGHNKCIFLHQIQYVRYWTVSR